MDTAQWPQEIVVKPTEEMVTNTCSSTTTTNTRPSTSLERKVRPQKDQALNCPRCNSTNTKFCYYNNYSLTQPRYFCKTCRRYWTDGGSLRNIPVGGGSRKNKRSSSSSATSISISSSKTSSVDTNSSKIKLPELITSNSSHPSIAAASHHHHRHNSKIYHHDGQDLNLGFPPNPEFGGLCEFIQLPNMENTNKTHIHPDPTTNTSSSATSAANISALELLSGLTSSRGLMPSFMPMPISDPNAVFSSGFALQSDFKPTLGFTLDGFGTTTNGYGNNLQGVQGTSNGRLLFPFLEDLKQVSSTSDQDNEQSREQGDSTGYWSGMLGGAGSW